MQAGIQLRARKFQYKRCLREECSLWCAGRCTRRKRRHGTNHPTLVNKRTVLGVGGLRVPLPGFCYRYAPTRNRNRPKAKMFEAQLKPRLNSSIFPEHSKCEAYHEYPRIRFKPPNENFLGKLITLSSIQVPEEFLLLRSKPWSLTATYARMSLRTCPASAK